MIRMLLCRVTFQHRGGVSADEKGVFWYCNHCRHRIYVGWDEM